MEISEPFVSISPEKGEIQDCKNWIKVNFFALSFQLCRELGGYPYNGLLNWYDGGGYAVTLGNTAKSSRIKLDQLKNENWIDRYTAAIFVEFTVSSLQRINDYDISYFILTLNIAIIMKLLC